MPTAADPVPAIIESEASGDIAEIFRDIRALTGVGVVNLVWRRLAITPDALPALWAMVRPAYASGHIAAEAQAFRRELEPVALPALLPAALTAAGVDRLAQLSIRAILDSYNRTNAMNLIALSAAVARLDMGQGESLSAPAGHSGLSEEAPLPPLPPLPAMSALDPHLRELVESLNAMCEQDGRIIASMYRHLSFWPGYLALVQTLLAPVVANGQMQSAIDDVRRQAAVRARTLAKDLRPLHKDLDQSVVDDIHAVLDLFTQHPIAKMAAICGALSCATPALPRA